MSAALRPLTDDELDADVARYWRTIGEGLPGHRVPGLYRVMAHNPAIIEPFHRYARVLFMDAGLDPVLRQLVILRTIWLERCGHAWQQHLLVSRDVGVAPALIEAIGNWEHGEFDPVQRAALRIVDLIVIERGGRLLTDEEMGELSSGEVIVVELLAGLYITICRLLNSAGLAAETPVDAWPAGPRP